jgi:hypothetical protein
MNVELINTLKKMNTTELRAMFVRTLGYQPHSSLDRQVMITTIYGKVEELEMPDFVRNFFNAIAAAKKANARRFSDNDIRSMRYMRAEGYGYTAIAKVYGSSYMFVRNVCEGRLYKDVR